MSSMPVSKVFNGDCVAYMRTIPDNFFDIAIADPPYGMGNERFGGRFEKYNNGSRHVEWDTSPSQEYFDELFRVSRNQVIWGGNYFTLPPTRCFLIWHKTAVAPAFSQAEYAWTSFSANSDVFECMPHRNRNVSGGFHPTEKPIKLYSWVINKFAKEGDKIFDPNMGSQTSRVAAYLNGYDYYGCEINEDYFNKGCNFFDKIINGICKDADGNIVSVQPSLFDEFL